MELTGIATELTTPATDLGLGLVCIALAVRLYRFRLLHRWKSLLWTGVFSLLAAASLLGAILHGLSLGPAVRDFLWQPLYLMLGIDVALFVLGAVYDWRGEETARRMLPVMLAVGIGFYCATLPLKGGFVVFLIFEGAAMATAMAIYAALALRKQLDGAGVIAAAIALNLAAAALQTTSLHITIVWPFDHNGIFHLVQVIALVTLHSGLRSGLSVPGHAPHPLSMVRT